MSYRMFSLLSIIIAFSSLSTLHAAQQQLPDSSAASDALYIELQLQSIIEKYETSSNKVRLEMEEIRIARHSAESLFGESKVLLEEASVAAASSPPDLKLAALKKKTSSRETYISQSTRQRT